jgi:hypothetical protein
MLRWGRAHDETEMPVVQIKAVLSAPEFGLFHLPELRSRVAQNDFDSDGGSRNLLTRFYKFVLTGEQ